MIRTSLYAKRLKAASETQALLEKAGLAQGSFTTEALIARSDRYVGRSILLLPFDCPPRGDGAVFFAGNRYVICYRANTDELHRRHIIMHELAHIVLGHRTPIDDGWLSFSPENEREADLLADELVTRSLGIEENRRPWILQWWQGHVNTGHTIEQDRLRSLFE